MKQVRKRIGSLLLSVCMILTMLPTVAFAETSDVDSGTPEGEIIVHDSAVSEYEDETVEITAFTALAEDVAAQTVAVGTVQGELNLPNTLTATVTTGSAFTEAVSGDSTATDREVQEPELQKEETTVDVSGWTSDPAYDSNTEGTYVFTPDIDLPDDVTLAEGITPPTITVTVEAVPVTMLRSSPALFGGSAYDYVIDLSGELDTGNTVGTDGYDISNGGTSIMPNGHGEGKNYRVTGATNDYNLWVIYPMSLTLDNVSIETSNGSALGLGFNIMTTLTLIGTNSLTGELSGIGGSTKEDLTIDGTGTLTTNIIMDLKSLTINSGTVNAAIDANSVTINGGTVNAAADEDFGIYAESAITITGGSVYAAGRIRATNIQPTNGTDSVYMTTLVGLPSNTAVTNLTAPASYGYEGMKTDKDGKLYLWLPEGSQDFAFKVGTVNINKTFTIAANNNNLFAAVDISTDVADATELKSALESTSPSTINVTADITFTEMITQGADHTLVIPNDKTVTASSTSGVIGIGSHTLTINGGGTFVCNRSGGNAIYSNDGMLNLENIIIDVTGRTAGICVKIINLDSGATVNLNSTGKELIRLNDSYVLNINTGGAIIMNNFNNLAISNYGGTLHINGGSLTVGKGQSDNQSSIWMSNGLLKYSFGTFNAIDGAVIHFNGFGDSTFVEGVSGKFIDRGWNCLYGRYGANNEKCRPQRYRYRYAEFFG